MPDLPCLSLVFDDHPLTVVLFEGRPAVSARALGAALGYGRDGGRLLRLLHTAWRPLLVPGVDTAELRLGARSAPARMLFESGLLLVLGRSRQPTAPALRAWWQTEVPPRLARRGGQVIRLLPRQRQVPLFAPERDTSSLQEALAIVAGLGLRLDALAGLDVAVEDRKAVAR